MNPISLIIVDDHAFTRSGLQYQLEQDGRFDVLGQAGSAVETLALARKAQPQVAVVDYALPDATGLEIVIELKRWVPDCAAVILTGRDDGAIVQPLLDADVKGILNKGSKPEAICEALAKVGAGGTVMDAVFKKQMGRSDTPVSLSPRELEVLIRIAKGMSNPAIADDLSLSAKTVETHRGNLMRKMDVSTTATLMVKAVRAGLIDL